MLKVCLVRLMMIVIVRLHLNGIGIKFILRVTILIVRIWNIRMFVVLLRMVVRMMIFTGRQRLL